MTEHLSVESETNINDGVDRREMLRSVFGSHDEETDGAVGGAVVGAVVGALVAGPVGALVGGALGAAAGGTNGAVDQDHQDGEAVDAGDERDR